MADYTGYFMDMRKRILRLNGRQARIALLAILEGKPFHEAIGIAESYREGGSHEEGFLHL